ncbi:hypothetical protein [Rubrobacter aplysinae]|uniref:hypothetical protein n=1 Tax=Rubrobacter aplysinae TaxID=909625 RepID=UPI00064C265C|nr:hypothetical protein [Rubrobacter aplysinae]
MGISRESQEPGSEYTMIGVVNDGVELNQAVKEVRDLGVGPDDMTVVLKRPATAQQEPFPQGTRYITIPDDRRGLEVPIGFAVSFVLLGIFFALVVPAIGIPTFVVFMSLAAILVAGSFTRVGISPILTDMEAPRQEAGIWNDEFEMGRVLVFATVRDRKMIRPIREALQRQGATYYIVNRRLEPRAVHQATLHRIGSSDLGGPIIGAQKA